MGQRLCSCCYSYWYYTYALEASQQHQQTTPSDDQQQQQQQAAAAAAADMLGDDDQQPIPWADPAGGIAVEEAIRDRTVRQRDESNARTANKREYGPPNCDGET